NNAEQVDDHGKSLHERWNMRAPNRCACVICYQGMNDINVKQLSSRLKGGNIQSKDGTEVRARSSDLEFDPSDDATINVSQDVLEELSDIRC
ncbi:hypothetical protein Hamer_G027458, partial [Homarus americanus]